MGAGASVLQGNLVSTECFGGIYGYTVDFPPGFFDSSESDDSDMEVSYHDAIEGLY